MEEPRAKGSNFIPVVKALRVDKDRARAALPPALHRYVEQRILPSSWYPEADLAALLEGLARMLPGSVEECWDNFGVEAAKAHAAGVYESVVRGGPLALVQGLDGFWQLLHSSGTWHIERAANGHATVRIAGLRHANPEFGLLLRAYLRQMLLLSGAQDVAVTLIEYREGSGTWEARWRAAA